MQSRPAALSACGSSICDALKTPDDVVRRSAAGAARGDTAAAGALVHAPVLGCAHGMADELDALLQLADEACDDLHIPVAPPTAAAAAAAARCAGQQQRTTGADGGHDPLLELADAVSGDGAGAVSGVRVRAAAAGPGADTRSRQPPARMPAAVAMCNRAAFKPPSGAGGAAGAAANATKQQQQQQQARRPTHAVQHFIEQLTGLRIKLPRVSGVVLRERYRHVECVPVSKAGYAAHHTPRNTRTRARLCVACVCGLAAPRIGPSPCMRARQAPRVACPAEAGALGQRPAWAVRQHGLVRPCSRCITTCRTRAWCHCRSYHSPEGKPWVLVGVLVSKTISSTSKGAPYSRCVRAGPAPPAMHVAAYRGTAADGPSVAPPRLRPHCHTATADGPTVTPAGAVPAV